MSKRKNFLARNLQYKNMNTYAIINNKRTPGFSVSLTIIELILGVNKQRSITAYMRHICPIKVNMILNRNSLCMARL